MPSNFTLRDLLYLDFDKAASIWSQFEEGLLERVSVTEDTGKDRTAGTKFGIPGIAEANLGVDYLQKRSTLQSKTLHHDVLNRVENRLVTAKLVTDLSAVKLHDQSSPEEIRAALGDRPYLRASGWSVIEDYRHILAIALKFNDVVGFIVRAGQENAKKSPEYQQLQALITEAKGDADRTTDRNQRAAKRAGLKNIQGQLEDMTKAQLEAVDQWLIDGMRVFIETFMPSRINFRIYPFPDCPSFQILCNLKRDCFVDSDLEHLLYGYGNRPNVPLAVFGLITSLPPEGDLLFDPMREFTERDDLSSQEVFESAFRGVFIGMEGVESFVRYSRYPNVTIHPIAVYRSFAVPEFLSP
jgi:hypothetical protein